MTGDVLHGLSAGGRPRITAASGAAGTAGGVGPAGGAGAVRAAGGAGATGETTAAARRTAKAIRDFQAVFLMEMMKPLTQELAGASSGDAADAGFGLSSGADVYSYFWGEALAQRLVGALPGLPGMTAIEAEKIGVTGGTDVASRSLVGGSAGWLAAVDAPPAATSPIGDPFSGPLLAGSRPAEVDPLAAGVTMDGLSALAAVRAAGTVSPDATAAVVPSAATTGRARGASALSEEVHALAGKAGRLFSLPENLVRAIVAVESGGRASAVSGKGAVGLMQLMPGTAREMGVKDPRDAWDNLVGGAKYIARQLERFGRLDHALAAYNAGPGAVEKHGGVPPFPETRDYVRRVLAVKARLDRTNPVGT